MLANRFLATAVLGFLGATTALADGGHRGGGRGHAYGHYRYTPAVVSARVVDVEPMVRYVTVNRPREQCWDEVVREPVRPYGVAGPTAAGSIVGAAIGRQFGSGNDRDALTVLGAVAGGAVAHQRAVRNGAGATRDVTVQRCEVVNDRVTGADRRRLSRDVSARRPQLHDADRPASRRLGAARGRRAPGRVIGCGTESALAGRAIGPPGFRSSASLTRTDARPQAVTAMMSRRFTRTIKRARRAALRDGRRGVACVARRRRSGRGAAALAGVRASRAGGRAARARAARPTLSGAAQRRRLARAGDLDGAEPLSRAASCAPRRCKWAIASSTRFASSATTAACAPCASTRRRAPFSRHAVRSCGCCSSKTIPT